MFQQHFKRSESLQYNARLGWRSFKKIVLIIIPHNLQTIIIAQMLFTGGDALAILVELGTCDRWQDKQQTDGWKDIAYTMLLAMHIKNTNYAAIKCVRCST